ncbi:MAG TPA: arsinothricin resistance N-acetyltransferase ArsN1 family B [Telluria sp.]|nr:arsinothricin resistance N-acetyltransferase ArsN1 family B [Telluria sp.]
MTIQLRSAGAADAPALAALYNHYVEHTPITFEELPVAAADMAARIASVQEHGLPWLVLEDGGAILGYAYVTPWRARSAYRHSVESTVYLAQAAHGRGHGKRLYTQLLADLHAGGLHTVIGGIALPNQASVALHERLGFRQVAQFQDVGRKFGQWIDVGYWQLML